MSSDHRTILSLTHPRPDVLERALAPEAGSIPGEAEATVECHDGELRVVVTAPDLSALRAGVNGWATLLGTTSDAARPDGR